MSYHSQALLTQSPEMLARVSAAYASEGVDGDPQMAASSTRWEWAVAPGWGDAVDSAIAAGNDAWATDPAVITDGQILAEVQRLMGS